MSVMHITKENFKELVLENEKPVLLDFWAAWCGPCRIVGPIIDQIAEEHPELAVGKVDVDAEQNLAQAFGVSSIPTLVAIKDGKVVNRTVGAQPKAEILKMF